MPTTTTAQQHAQTRDATCPAWCTTNHAREACHFSGHTDFADANGKRFRVEIARDPAADKRVVLYLDEPAAEPLARTWIEAMPVERAAAFVEALQWARRTSRQTEPHSALNAALSLAADINAIVESVLDSPHITDEQRRRVLSETRDRLCDVFTTAQNKQDA